MVDADYLADVGPGLALAVRPFALDGRPFAVIVAKVTLSFSTTGILGQYATIVSPEPVTLVDERTTRSVLSSVARASDLALGKGLCDVTLVGAARSATPAPSIATRLRVSRGERALLDKCVVVSAGRDARGAPIPITSAPLVWEDAPGGRHASAAARASNPVGSATGRLSKRGDPEGPAAYGPIPPEWGVRAALLSSEDAAALRAEIPALRRAFPWAHFQCAPIDQRVPFLAGDERVRIEGVAESPVDFTLPALRAAAVVVRGTSVTAAPLVIDTLAIDAERGVAHLVLRALAERPTGKDVVVARIACEAEPELPTRGELAPQRGTFVTRQASSASGGATLTLAGPPPDARNASAPFLIAPAGMPRPRAPSPGGTPWATPTVVVPDVPATPEVRRADEATEPEPLTPPPRHVLAAHALRRAGVPEWRIAQLVARYRASLHE